MAHAIKESLNWFDLDIQNCRGQGYDGANNMSSARGVQGHLLAENAKAIYIYIYIYIYIHCNSHILNLCIVGACSLPPICNMNSTITESAFFFQNSEKRQIFFEKIINSSTSMVNVKDLCSTRWVYRHEAYEDFHIFYQFLVCTMEATTDRDLTYGIMNWDTKMIVSANGLLKMYLSFPFIVSFIVTMNLMSIIKPVSIKLQKRCTDIVKAYTNVKDVLNEFRCVCQSEEMLHSWFVQAEAIALKVDVVSEVPRVFSQ